MQVFTQRARDAKKKRKEKEKLLKKRYNLIPFGVCNQFSFFAGFHPTCPWRRHLELHGETGRHRSLATSDLRKFYNFITLSVNPTSYLFCRFSLNEPLAAASRTTRRNRKTPVARCDRSLTQRLSRCRLDNETSRPFGWGRRRACGYSSMSWS